MSEHVLFSTGDEFAPDSIKDSNGEVVLGLCKICNKGEAKLDGPCLDREKQPRKIDFLLEGWKTDPKGVADELAQRHPFVTCLMIYHGFHTGEFQKSDVGNLAWYLQKDYEKKFSDEYGEKDGFEDSAEAR